MLGKQKRERRVCSCRIGCGGKERSAPPPECGCWRTDLHGHFIHQRGRRTKSGLILGMGETLDEAREVMRDLRSAGCDIMTIGQYLQPTREHLPVARFYDPSEFAMLKEEGRALGFSHVESGPLVRSSYHAEQQVV